MEGDVETRVAAEAAHAVVRKFFARLYKVVVIGDIPMKLYASELIDQPTLSLGQEEKGTRILLDMQEKISQSMDGGVLDELCKILREEDTTLNSLTKDIQDGYKKEVEKKKKEIEAQISGKNELERLKKQLEAFRLTGQMQDPPEGLKNVIERTLQNYIETSLEASVSPKIVKEQLKELCEKHSLISSEMLEWGLRQHENLVMRQSPPLPVRHLEVAHVTQDTAPVQMGAPLLSPSILYHAGLVCQAVNTCVSTKAVYEFLKDKGHELHAVSLSLSNSEFDTYLVAKNDNIIYVAFRSKPTLKSWLSQHKSFEEGLKEQTQKIPLRFFIEQLLKKNKIVFTGFSYGGMLACCVTSCLWRAGYLLSTALLQKNVTCITFGQPLFNIPYVCNTVQRFPELEDTIHLILDKEDKIPGLLHYYQVGCVLKAQRAMQQPSTPLSRINATDFKIPFNSEFLQALCALKDKITKATYSKAVKSGSPTKKNPANKFMEIMKKLAEMDADKATHPETLCGKLYLMSSDEKDKIIWRGEVTKKVVFEELIQNLLREMVQDDVFKLHTVESYRMNTTTAYLKREAGSSLPSVSSNAELQEVGFLKPRATSAEFHMFPNEHVIVLEGNNLWFCHKVHIGRQENTICIDSPSNIMRGSIQFSFKPTEKTEKLCENGGVHVTLYSHFVPQVSKNIHTKKEPYSFSLRQIQLAKHTPTEIIQLAYCTAMLERPLEPALTEQSDQLKTSKRHNVVVDFLEEAGKTVPLESVFHVIAHSSEDTALQCARALKRSEINFPPSQMMVFSSLQAAHRVESGLTDEQYLEKQRQHMNAQGLEITMPIPYLPPPVPVPLETKPVHVPFLTPTPSGSNPNVTSQQMKSTTPQRQTQPKPKGRLYSEVAEKLQPPPGLTTPQRQTQPKPKGRLYSEVAEKLQPPPGHSFTQTIFPTPSRPEYSNAEMYAMLKAAAYSNLPPDLPPLPAWSPMPPLYPIPAIPVSPLDSELAAYLKRVYYDIVSKARSRGDMLQLICNRSIEHFCPFSLDRTALGTTLPSPIQALVTARRQLMEAALNIDSNRQSQSPLRANTEIINIVKKIRDSTLKICSAILAAFMEQQIRIPLIKSDLDTAKLLSSTETPVAVGSWAFVSMQLPEIQEIIASTGNNQLIVEMGDYFMSLIEQANKTSSAYGGLSMSLPHDVNYADKLLFLVRGIKTGKTVTCSTQFISYSLERQLFQLSKQLKFDKKVKEKTLLSKWDSTFKGNALSLVAPSHRPLLARWLIQKWALLIHDLRETLAEYTCVGIIGLSNSGKSLLVNTLFDVQVHVGTTEKKRTVVPFLYNMDGRVDKLDVIDFPGVDDVSSVPEVTKLLVNLAQVVIFVVDYKNFSSTMSIEWMKRLENEDVQVLVCLTYGDNLYTEVKKEIGTSSSTTKLTHRIKQELAQAEERVGHHPSRTINYYCFDLPSSDKSLNEKILREVGVYSPKDVGNWLVKTFTDKLAQRDLAEKLKMYFSRKTKPIQ